MSLSIRNTLFLMTAAVAIGCRQGDVAEAPKPDPVYFPAAEVCSYPSAGPGKLFANLSGGRWEPANAKEPNSSYECVGAKQSVQFYNTGGTTVEVEFIATGIENGSSMVSLTYSAVGPGPIPNESTHRNAFANLVDGITRQSLGSAPPELLRKKISNLASYSQPGKGFTENYDVGKGFISLGREATPNSEIRVYVKLFPDVALKLE